MDKQDFAEWAIPYYEDIYNCIKRDIDKDILSFYSVRSYFRHLPLRYTQKDLPEEIHQVVDKCFHALYDYSIKKHIIDKNITYDDFYNGKGVYDESFPMSEKFKR